MQVQKFFAKNVGALTNEYGQRKELAIAVGLTEQQIQNILNGTTKKGCGLTYAWLIAKHLGCSLDELCLPPSKFKAVQKRVQLERAEAA